MVQSTGRSDIRAVPDSFKVVAWVHSDACLPAHAIVCMPVGHRMLLNATLPKIFQRKVLRWLPPELGQYVLDAGRPFNVAGEIALVRTVKLQAPLCMHMEGVLRSSLALEHVRCALRHHTHSEGCTSSAQEMHKDGVMSCRSGQRCRLWTRMCPIRRALCRGQRTTRGQPSTARLRRRPAACSVSQQEMPDCRN